MFFFRFSEDAFNATFISTIGQLKNTHLRFVNYTVSIIEGTELDSCCFCTIIIVKYLNIRTRKIVEVDIVGKSMPHTLFLHFYLISFLQ